MKDDFELSPLAEERLRRIEAPSLEERERLKETQWLESLLASYFTKQISTDELWKELKERNKAWMVKEAQERMVDSLSLGGGEDDFSSSCKAILAIETLRKGGDYPSLEQTLNEVEHIRKSYKEGKEKAYQELKREMESQVRLLAQQALSKGMKVDVETSVEANIKASPRWKSFTSQHEKEHSQRFEQCIAKLERML